MASIRPDKPKQSRFRGEQRVSRRKDGKKRTGNVIHVIPDIFYTSAVALPFITIGPGESQSAITVVSDVLHGSTPIGQGVNNFISAVSDNVIPDLIPMAELAAVGYGLRWLGKKVGLNRIGTKRVKIA